MKNELMNIRSIVMGIVVVMLVYLATNMVLNAGRQHKNSNSNRGVDPAIHLGVGNKMINRMDGGGGGGGGGGGRGGDMVGIYSANLTGGIKLNYPWPLRDGPGMSVSMNA
jgi:hypothetical protein